MPKNRLPIKVETGNDLDHLVEVVGGAGVVLERDGERYRLFRVSDSARAPSHDQPLEPE